MIILGVDPGSRITGYGVIVMENGSPSYIASGCIRTNADDIAQRLQQIFHGLREIVSEFQPTSAAIEQVFMHRNANSALKLGQARGAAIVAISMTGIAVSEYSARQVKQAVAGYGAAQKNQIQQMVQTLLKLSDKPQEDAADALAIALCHGHTQHSNRLLMPTGK